MRPASEFSYISYFFSLKWTNTTASSAVKIQKLMLSVSWKTNLKHCNPIPWKYSNSLPGDTQLNAGVHNATKGTEQKHIIRSNIRNMHFQTWPAWVLVLLLLNCLINHHMVQWEGYQAFRNGIPATADCSFQHHWVKSSCFNISGWYVWRSLHQVFAFFLVKQEPSGILDEVEEKNITMDLRMGDSIYVQEILSFTFTLLKFYLLNVAH